MRLHLRCMLFACVLAYGTVLQAGQDDRDASQREAPSMHLPGLAIGGQDLKVQCKCLPVAGRFHLTIEGDVKIRLFDGDVEIRAEQIALVMDGEFPLSLLCIGPCVYQEDGGLRVTGDKLKVAADGSRVFGNASVTYGSGAYRTTAKAESICIKDGELTFTGSVSIRLGPPEEAKSRSRDP